MQLIEFIFVSLLEINYMSPFKKRLDYAVFYAFILFSTVACNKESMKTVVSLTAYNHTEHGVGSLS